MCISGTFLNPWSFQKDAKQKAHMLAARLGCPTISSRQMVTCLKEKDAADIVIQVQLFLVKQNKHFSDYIIIFGTLAN